MLGGAAGVLVAAVGGYLLGAFPTGYLVARVLRGTDIRVVGSGHTGGSNVGRTAGMAAGIATALIDILLGLGAVALASVISDSSWALAAAGSMAVVGHNWSVFLGFGGGIGLTTIGGALLWFVTVPRLVVPVVVIGLWVVLVKLVRVRPARATIVALALLGPIAWAIGAPPEAIVIAVLGGLAAIIKTLPDWNRSYD